VVSDAKTAELMEMPFGIGTRVGQGNIVRNLLGGGAHWRHLLNTIKPSMCGGDAAFCQITLTTCYCSYHSTFLQTVADSIHTVRSDKTRQFRRVVVGGAY